MGSGVVVLARTARLTMTVVVKSQITHYSLDPMFLTNNLLQKNIGKIAQVKKKLQPSENINRIYDKKLPYNCPQQLPTFNT